MVKKRFDSLSFFNRMSNHITAHCPFHKHVEKLVITANNFCKSFGFEQEKETVFHLMCQCYCNKKVMAFDLSISI